MPRALRGNALLGFLVLLGLVLCAICALLTLLARGPRSAPFWLAGALVFTAVSAITLWQRDRVALLKVLLFATVTPALLVGMWAAFLPDGQGVFLPALAVLVLLAAAVGFGLWRELNRRTPLHPAPGPGEPGVLHLQPEISGPRGARMRPRRVRVQGDTAHAVEQFLRGGSGQLPWGARLQLQLPRLTQPPPPQPAEAPEPSWQLLWTRGGARSAA